ncbi:MAG: hypothetical protein FWH28_05420 [Clostridiales bacterium]|nr:hypothetical protein [Clostridiales bacterium]
MNVKEARSELWEHMKNKRKVCVTLDNGDEYFGFPSCYCDEFADAEIGDGFSFMVNNATPEMQEFIDKGISGFSLPFIWMEKIEVVASNNCSDSI